ncbi:MAG: hypothetical protein IPK26_00810 [Planctomycetes bacterium]|nr:hypothetical protein [Planctomycetota bacterium]
MRSIVFSCSLLAGSLLAQGVIDEGPEPNDLTGVPTFITCGSRIDGNLTAGDFDYYQMAVTAPTLVKAYTSVGPGSIARTDTWLEFRDSMDMLLAEDDDAGQGTSSYAGCYITTPGIYYLVVRGFAATTAGPYTMDVMCTSAVVVEGVEPNSGSAAATPGTCGFEHHGEITAGDDDWYSIVHPGGNLVVTSGPGGPGMPPSAIALEDTIVEVYDVNSVLLGTADDEGESLYSALTIPNAPAGQYYALIKGFAAADFGWYSLRIGCGEPAPAEAQIGPGVGTPVGCMGSAGVPTLLARSTNATGTGTRVRPRIGTTFSLDLSNLPPASLVVHITGLATPPPFDLGPLGAPGCFVGVSTDLTSIDFANPAGTARSWLFIPGNPVFIGTPLHWQSASLSPSHNAFGIATSNVLSGVVNGIAFQ